MIDSLDQSRRFLRRIKLTLPFRMFRHVGYYEVIIADIQGDSEYVVSLYCMSRALHTIHFIMEFTFRGFNL